MNKLKTYLASYKNITINPILNYEKVKHYMLFLKRSVFKCFLNKLFVSKLLRSNGSSFQSLGAAMEKALSLYVLSLDFGTARSF